MNNLEALTILNILKDARIGMPHTGFIYSHRDCMKALDIAIDAIRGLNRVKQIITQNIDLHDTDRLYIEVFADYDPGTKAEKLYQICSTDELVDIMECLKEYCKCEEL